ncbi:8-oxoguanine deaminase [Agromyces mediolanus]|uniref:8-oxoguanine deaminase n=1 Tax=Agromyces mediolanus TaxID=41986 RepID=A0A918CHN8_AGRME|nr:8-oxoguanine deaminase [Agromyces mediolanus]GGR24794.1 8-oxoguanine deaminase [Agromyces mediolanus]GLJ70910.1 8-oxoguanine deaminase [Agromyces mediolanus]
MARVWIKNPAAVFTAADHAPGAADGGIVVEGGRIVELLRSGATPSKPVSEVFDAANHVVLPGLINTHHHFFQTLTRAWAPVADAKLFPWLQGLYPVWARLTPESLELAVTVALAELLLSGCTTAADHHYVFPEGLDEAIDLEVEAVRRLGMRATLTRGSMTLGQRDGGLPPQSVVQDGDVILADSERLIDRYHSTEPDADVHIALAPCSPFSVTREIMSESAELAARRGVRLHTHLAETLDEEEFCRERFGLRTVDYLESVGWLGPQSWLGHGIHFDEQEIARLGAAGTGVAHCPTSNMRLASGIARAIELEDAGVPVGLGVDGSASNDSSNLIQEVRQALYLQRLRYGADVPVTRALGWATLGSARALGRDGELGSIELGKQADLALFTLDELRFSGSHDPIAALVLCGADRADRVMVGGEWRVVDGRIPGLDLDGLISAHSKAARRLVLG